MGHGDPHGSERHFAAVRRFFVRGLLDCVERDVQSYEFRYRDSIEIHRHMIGKLRTDTGRQAWRARRHGRYGRSGMSSSLGSRRLPASELRKVTPGYVFNAIRRLLAGFTAHRFGKSTDYDVLLEDGTRLAPKAVFGLA